MIWSSKLRLIKNNVHAYCVMNPLRGAWSKSTGLIILMRKLYSINWPAEPITNKSQPDNRANIGIWSIFVPAPTSMMHMLRVHHPRIFRSAAFLTVHFVNGHATRTTDPRAYRRPTMNRTRAHSTNWPKVCTIRSTERTRTPIRDVHFHARARVRAHRTATNPFSLWICGGGGDVAWRAGGLWCSR